MPVTTYNLRTYLGLERQMLAIDSVDGPVADRIREAMDTLWYALTDEEHSELDARVVNEPCTRR